MAAPQVHPHPTGPWLVTWAGRRFAVEAELGRRLQAQDEVPPELAGLVEWNGGNRAGPAVLRRHPLWLRIHPVSEQAVAGIARGLAPFSGWSWLAGSAAVGGVAHLLAAFFGEGAQPIRPDGLPAFLLGIGLFLVTALWHECGHAAALSGQGYPPGRLGAGFLALIPVLFVDVSAAALLPRRGRLRVNAAGPCFQVGLGGLMHLAGSVLPAPPRLAGALTLAATSSLLAVAWSLWPMVRSDGYWLVCDALGIPGLDRPLPPGKSRTVRRLTATARTFHALFFLTLGLAAPWFAAARLGPAWSELLERLQGFWPAAAVRVLPLMALAGLWWSLGCRIARLIRLNRLDRSRATQRE